MTWEERAQDICDRFVAGTLGKTMKQAIVDAIREAVEEELDYRHLCRMSDE